MEQYEGHLEHLQSQTMGLSKRLCASHMVSYSFTATKTSGSGSNADIQFYSSTSTGPTDFLFQRNAVAIPSATVSLPFGHGFLNPYRVTAGITARPAYFVVTSRTGPLDFTVHAQVIDRNQPCQVEFPFVPCLPSAEYNTGGSSIADATAIQLGETIRGNVHNREDNILNKGGQWFKFTIQPGQAVSASGTVLGGPIWGSSFGMQLWNAAGTQLGSLGTQHAVNGVFEFPLEATLNYISTYTHTGATPQTIYLQVYGQVGITHEFTFRVREVMMKFTILSKMIDPVNKHSEDVLIRGETMWGPDGIPLVEFSQASIGITEISKPSRYQQNGGILPTYFRLTRGVGEFLARSLVGPDGASTPAPALLKLTSYRLFGSSVSFEVPQWWKPDIKIDSLADDLVPAWLQSRLLQLRLSFSDQPATAAFDSVSSYKVYYEPGLDGTCAWEWRTKNPIHINVFGDSKMRLDKPYPISSCRIAGKKIGRLTGTFLHEARHCYQMNQGQQIIADGLNDSDGDLLVRHEYASSSFGTMLDSPSPRNVCDLSTNS
ncbi:MAG: hypothetical protein MUF01_06985, partial [Bryobacterales bacterium]|nr:hypothetical protein [Bryobacterales bacterium]